MGNEASSYAGSPAGPPLQSQGLNSPWTVVRKDAEDGEVCEFSHQLESNIRDDLCKTALEHLRILRHPNVLKFLGSETSSERVVMMTEVVSPLVSVAEKLHTEAVILGWKDILLALDFLHSRAKLSHNNLHVGCIYVSVVNSRWKVGGFEAVQLHSKMDAAFLSLIAAYRHPRAVPPEDKVSAPKREVPCHSRDIWACGQLLLDIPKETGGLDTTVITYVQEEMLNPDPLTRPSALAVSQQVWMKTAIGTIADFLTHLTLHSREDKEAFFGSLIERLRVLPPKMVAERIMPLLTTPLVVTETADHPLWCAVFTTEPSLTNAASLLPSDASLHSVKPLFTQELFVAHVIPLLLSLLASRDKQVRLLLLKYLGVFAPLCKDDDLRSTVLPEVLVGLRDSCNELVSSTLHALGHLVPLIGSKAVVGTPGKPIFAGSLPRGKPVTMETSSVSIETSEGAIVATLLSPSPPLSTASSDAERSSVSSKSHSSSKHSSSKHPDHEHQRERRERNKAKTHISLKLTTCTSSLVSASEPPMSGGGGPLESDCPGSVEPAGDDGLQPSSIHDQLHWSGDHQWKVLYSHEGQSGTFDNEGESLDNEGESLDNEEESLDNEGEPHVDKGQPHGEEDDEGEPLDKQSLEPVYTHQAGMPECLSGVSDKGAHFGSTESTLISGVDGGVAQAGSSDAIRDLRSGVVQNGSSSGSSRFKGTADRQNGSQIPASLRGQMSEEDRERLEQKAMWSREPDVFAELGMAPSIQPAPMSLPNQKGVTTTLAYQAPTCETVGKEWEGWEEWGSI